MENGFSGVRSLQPQRGDELRVKTLFSSIWCINWDTSGNIIAVLSSPQHHCWLILMSMEMLNYSCSINKASYNTKITIERA